MGQHVLPALGITVFSSSLHLTDEMIDLLRSGKINNRLLCELATHPNFRRLMIDMEICIDRIGK